MMNFREDGNDLQIFVTGLDLELQVELFLHELEDEPGDEPDDRGDQATQEGQDDDEKRWKHGLPPL